MSGFRLREPLRFITFFAVKTQSQRAQRFAERLGNFKPAFPAPQIQVVFLEHPSVHPAQ